MSDCITTMRTLYILQKAGHVFDFEPILAYNYRRLLAPGDVVVDVGAHSGRHFDNFVSLVGAGGRAIAVEPLPDCVEYLKSRYQDHANVAIHNLALSNFSGTAEFVAVENSPEESGLREKIYNAPDRILKKILVRVDTLDNLVVDVQKIDFIKIDVEGAEINLLEGARECLRRTRPFVSVEYGFPGYSAYGNANTSLFDLARSMNYCCADLYGNLIDDRADWVTVCDSVYWDYLLVPDEKRAEFKQRLSNLAQ